MEGLRRGAVMISVLTPCLEETPIYNKNKILLGKDSRVTEFLTDSDRSIGKARDNLLRKARNDLLLWVDSDIELSFNPIDIFLNILNRNGNIVGVCGVSHYTGNDWKIVLTEAASLMYLEDLPEEYEAWEGTFECSLFKKQPMIDVGGFDSNLDYGGEDNELYHRLKEKNWKVVKIKKVPVLHHTNHRKYWEKVRKWKISHKTIAKKHSNYNPTFGFEIRFNLFQKFIHTFYYLWKMKKPHYIFLFPYWKLKGRNV